MANHAALVMIGCLVLVASVQCSPANTAVAVSPLPDWATSAGHAAKSSQVIALGPDSLALLWTAYYQAGTRARPTWQTQTLIAFGRPSLGRWSQPEPISTGKGTDAQGIYTSAGLHVLLYPSHRVITFITPDSLSESQLPDVLREFRLSAVTLARLDGHLVVLGVRRFPASTGDAEDVLFAANWDDQGAMHLSEAPLGKAKGGGPTLVTVTRSQDILVLAEPARAMTSTGLEAGSPSRVFRLRFPQAMPADTKLVIESLDMPGPVSLTTLAAAPHGEGILLLQSTSNVALKVWGEKARSAELVVDTDPTSQGGQASDVLNLVEHRTGGWTAGWLRRESAPLSAAERLISRSDHSARVLLSMSRISESNGRLSGHPIDAQPLAPPGATVGSFDLDTYEDVTFVLVSYRADPQGRIGRRETETLSPLELRLGVSK